MATQVGLGESSLQSVIMNSYPVFVDIHIDNRSSKDVKKVEMQLEKAILFHDYSAPSANTKTTSTLRVPDHVQKEIIVSSQLSGDFDGVCALSQDFRTCQMQLPTGLVSIETGTYSTTCSGNYLLAS